MDHGVYVVDTRIDGPGLSIDLRRGGPRRFIIIDGTKSWLHRLFILLHEIGHLFKYKDLQLEPLRRNQRREVEANRTAVEILRQLKVVNGIDLVQRYADFYNDMNKNTRRAKFIVD